MATRRKRKLGERIITALGGATSADVSSRALEAYQQGYNDGGEDEPATSTLKKYGYRRVGGGGRESALDHDAMLDTAWALWQYNPVADRALEIKRDYIVGGGVTIQATNKELQAVLDKFWDDNRLRRRIKEFTFQLRLFGEQCYTAYVRNTDGRVRLGYIDPSEIDRVILHPENAMEIWAVVLKDQPAGTGEKWVKSHGKRVYRIIRRDESKIDESINGEGLPALTYKQSEHDGKYVTHDQAVLEDWEIEMLGEIARSDTYDGCCFYERINAMSNQPRGLSDLTQVADWLDQHDETLFNVADREQVAGFFLVDVTMLDADQEQCDAKAAKFRKNPPRKGSVNFHNDKETWKLDAPDLKQTASIETAKELLTYNLGGLGLPNHFYGHGDETNRATAQAQGDPTWRTLETDQDIIRDLIMWMLEFVRDQAEIAGTWSPIQEASDGKDIITDGSTFTDTEGTEIDIEAEREIAVTMPEMTSRDLTAVSSAASALASALMVAEEKGWITSETAAEAWAKIMAELGVEVNPGEEVGQAQQGAEDADLDKAKSTNDYLAAHGVIVDPGAVGVTATEEL